jgi:Electron transfer DM13
MRSFLSRNGMLVTAIGLVIGAGAVYLVFFVFALQTLFIDKSVDEAGPVFAADAGETVPDSGTEISFGPETIVSGSFVDRSHPSSGAALVLGDGSGQRFLRFEDFATDNGPDLNVYLSTAPADAPAGEFDDDFVDLGDLKGNIGDQNYEIPLDVDLDRYTTVVIWCVRFGVAFGAADLT